MNNFETTLSSTSTNVIISGASNTDGPWPTWADLFQERYYGNFYNVSKKGLGNEAIINLALHRAWQLKDQANDTVILVMLTNIDKWDWYVDRADLVEKFAKEKHTITKLANNHRGGYWGTGRWFPLDKQLYKDNFYSEDYQIRHTLQMIGLFQQVCTANKWNYQILFDSPIWSTTNAKLDLGTTVDCTSNRLINTQENQWLYQSLGLKDANIYTPGLLGFLYKNNLPWFSQKYGPHPGTRSHYDFAKEKIFPYYDTRLSIRHDFDWLDTFVHKMDQLWT